MGWRTTAQNLNLNRDYVKADAPEMRAWLSVFNRWLPDILVDSHVTNGIDFQYSITYSMEMYENAPVSVVKWQERLRKSFIAGMAALGDPICPYVFPREDMDLSKGLLAYAASPRFSTGYAAVRNRAAVLIETHSLKPYKERVTATFRLFVEILNFTTSEAKSLRDAVRQADSETAQMFSGTARSPFFPVKFRESKNPDTIKFLGYESEIRMSDISGGMFPYWFRDKPIEASIPFFNNIRPVLSIQPPQLYIIPAEWTNVLDVLRIHGIKLERLLRNQTIPVETYLFSQPKWRDRPYESRFTLESVRSVIRFDTVMYPAGTFIARLNQPTAKIAIHLLEPDAQDSFIYWGFFNAIFEQKNTSKDT